MSVWFKLASAPSGYPMILSTGRANNLNENILYVSPSYKLGWGNSNANNDFPNSSGTTLSLNTWYHGVVTFNGSDTVKIYVNGSLDGSKTSLSGVNIEDIDIVIGARTNNGNTGKELYFEGSISNGSIWNAALTSSQVTEIYNEGVPSNLNNHSAYSNLVSWWQLGSNSSWVNPDWTVLDEKGSNNGTSSNMGEDAIVDGVGSYANGLSNGMGGDEVIGDAPYSTANSLSVNMDVEDRVTDTPS
jgi:hypothetical protein